VDHPKGGRSKGLRKPSRNGGMLVTGEENQHESCRVNYSFHACWWYKSCMYLMQSLVTYRGNIPPYTTRLTESIELKVALPEQTPRFGFLTPWLTRCRQLSLGGKL
jgi:hypothetical protein